MEYALAHLSPQERERLINSLIVPRPIAWVSSVDRQGVRNLAPFSYFTVASRDPPIVMISFGGAKDTLVNVAATGDFVIHVASDDLAGEMVASSAPYPPDVDEIALLGLEVVPALAVAAPRLVRARACLECTRHGVQEIGDSTLLFGLIRHVHVADEVLVGGRIGAARLAAVGRLGGAEYCTADRPYRLDKPGGG